jgi:hypothetical protein
MSLGILLALSMASSPAGEGAAPTAVAPPSAPPPASAPPASLVPPSAPPPTEAPSSEVAPPVIVAPTAPPAGALEPAAAEPVVASEPDYSNTWSDPPPTTTIVVTQLVHHPVRRSPPPPPPVSSYEPRAHGFLGLSLRGTTTVNGNPSALSGARLGFVFDDRFTIGGVFYSLTARYGGPIVDPLGHRLGMRMAYGGVLLGWSLYKGRVMRVGLETLAGAGAACVSRNRRAYGRWECIEKVGLVSLEPGLSVGFTVTDWVRVGFTGGYRFVTREAWREPNEFTLSGPYVGLDVDFGAFRERK